MKLKTKPLLAALADPCKIAGRRTTLPILNCVMMGVSTGQLVITATDLDVWVERVVTVEPADELLFCCVPAKRILGCIQGAGEEVDISFTSNKGGKLVVKSGAWRQEIGVQSDKEFPQRPATGGKEILINHGDLAETVRSVLWCVDQDPAAKPYTKSILVVSAAKSLEASSFKRVMFAKSKRASICPDLRFTIPGAQAAYLCDAMMQDGSKVTMTDKRITVSNPMGVVSAVLIEDEWPDTKAVTDLKTNPIATVDRDALLRACRRIASIHVFDRNGPVVVGAGGKHLSLESVTQTDTASEMVECSEAEATGDFRIDSFLWIEALESLEPGPVGLRVNDRQLFLLQGDRTVIISLMIDLNKK